MEKERIKVSLGSLLVALGIVYGDIGTSPLYVMKAILSTNNYNTTYDLVLGGVSLVFWTLTLQTTIKYVILTLKADNNGEGGIFSLYTLLKNKTLWLSFIAIIGGAALLADGMITPPVTVTSAIEGLNIILPLKTDTIVFIVFIILSILFIFQKFGTEKIGRIFGPLMFIWFSMLGILGFKEILKYPEILKALNPYYGIHLLIIDPEKVYILGAVFLCTTGAEALYSDLGHCGRKNIYYTWIFVKTSLVLNYLGQGAYLLLHNGEYINDNPFFLIMPKHFILAGVVISTFAAIIASQALISGSFTLISEAMKLNFFPRLHVRYPNDQKGQIYIPCVNYTFYLGCLFITFFFKKSENMEAAYGLAIIVTMMMTTILLSHYIRINKQKIIWGYCVLCIFLTIESSFLYANIFKIFTGGYVTLIIAGLLIFIMYVWRYGSSIKTRYVFYKNILNYVDKFKELEADMELPLYSTHLVYLTKSKRWDELETKILFSIFNKSPKRSKYYWFVNIEVTDEPHTEEYMVKTIVPNQIFAVRFRLGFRINQGINILLRQVIKDLVANGELCYTPKSYMISDESRCTVGDFKFIILEEILSNENNLKPWDNFIMTLKLAIKKVTVSPEKWFGIDTSIVHVERAPIIICSSKEKNNLKKIN
ncbi:KUP/HAK/KT family potassium transporter [Cetobacterium sp. SF1]|uniref:KUP/HAK/KT family potassium transporter n=1 Tax=Cetobacterium sp. SF1 TaxID=3417654 RepID=UPI003CE82B74